MVLVQKGIRAIYYLFDDKLIIPQTMTMGRAFDLLQLHLKLSPVQACVTLFPLGI